MATTPPCLAIETDGERKRERKREREIPYLPFHLRLLLHVRRAIFVQRITLARARGPMAPSQRLPTTFTGSDRVFPRRFFLLLLLLLLLTGFIFSLLLLSVVLLLLLLFVTEFFFSRTRRRSNRMFTEFHRR